MNIVVTIYARHMVVSVTANRCRV